MSNDEEDVLGIDLDAWEAPPPPANIADGVIARMRSEVTQVTVQALPVEQAPGRLPNKWWTAGAITILVAAGTIITVAATRSDRPANARGISAGDRAAHIALGPSSADVDPNTVVSWRREGERITAQQAGGVAAWRVGDDDTLTIETNLGSIEAINASLRVEVQMLDTKKQIALSAITAAAVSVVTIVVYEGVVRVRSGTTTTTVAPGTAYQIRAKGDNVIVEDAPVVGATAGDRLIELQTQIAEMEARLAKANAELDAATKQMVDPYRAAAPDMLPREEIQHAMNSVLVPIKKCAGGFAGRLHLTVTVNADGSVKKVDVDPPEKPADCISAIVAGVRFTPTKAGSTFKYPLTFTSEVDFAANPFKKACDADKLLERGQALYAAGQPGEALDVFEEAHRCKPEKQTLKLMFASACKSKQPNKAQQIWKKLPEPERNQIVSLCISNGILIEDLEATSGSGKLNVVNKGAPAKVLVDGVDVGMAPIYMDLPAGKHKVTLSVGADKHTFTVLIKAGETVLLSKDLE